MKLVGSAAQAEAGTSDKKLKKQKVKVKREKAAL
jgi:hypothetical protein